ncbi:hypothetical protein [Hydrogenophaga sp. 5NK40-0174]|uniref:hypothetical protein n=1 Tax=Hydrogenophaga sp. 5NK40-0174 TaxID=3127649 RepID=UPI00334115A0
MPPFLVYIKLLGMTRVAASLVALPLALVYSMVKSDSPISAFGTELVGALYFMLFLTILLVAAGLLAYLPLRHLCKMGVLTFEQWGCEGDVASPAGFSKSAMASLISAYQDKTRRERWMSSTTETTPRFARTCGDRGAPLTHAVQHRD